VSTPVSLRSLCRAPEIGANSYQLTFGEINLVLDAGMHPKKDGYECLPRYELLEENSVDAIFITHAHLDHLGTLPVLQREQSRAKVFMTPEVVDLSEALLHNSVNVMTSQGEELDIGEYPLFTHHELDQLSQIWQGRGYRRTFEPIWDEDLQVTFRDAGHVLGSAGILFEGSGKRIFYTGDVQFTDQSLISKADFDDLGELDAMIVTMIQNAKEEGSLPDVPMTIGGLSTKMTAIYDRYAENPNRKRPNFRILRDMNLRAGTRRRGKSVPIRYQEREIFALSSGMMSEKTVSNTFARGFLPNSLNSLHFVGYSDPSTPSYAIRQASKGDLVSLDDSKDPVSLNCSVKEYDFSGHADRQDLLDFIVAAKPKKIFLVHGDPPASAWFKEQLSLLLPDSSVEVPEPAKSYEL